MSLVSHVSDGTAIKKKTTSSLPGANYHIQDIPCLSSVILVSRGGQMISVSESRWGEDYSVSARLRESSRHLSPPKTIL